MKKLLVLSFIFAITCSGQVFSMEDFEIIGEEEVPIFYKDKSLGENERKVLAKFVNWSLEKLAELKCKDPNKWNTIKSKVINKENTIIDDIIAYLIIEAAMEGNVYQTKKDNINYIINNEKEFKDLINIPNLTDMSKYKEATNRFMNVVNACKKAITGSNDLIKYKMFNVFIKTFSSSLSNIISNIISNEEKEQNEKMKFWFKDIVYRNVVHSLK